jgi:hypothetical protein
MNNPTPLCDSHKPMTSKVLLTRTQLQMRSGSDSQITEPAGLFLSERPRYAEWHIAAYKHVSYTVHLCSDLLDPNNPTLASAGSSGEASGRRRLIVLDAQVHNCTAAAFRATSPLRVWNANCIVWMLTKESRRWNRSLVWFLQ